MSKDCQFIEFLESKKGSKNVNRGLTNLACLFVLMNILSP